MPGKQLDVVALKAQVETAMEVLLRAADARVQWKPPKASTEPPVSRQTLYSFLPGVYRSVEPQYHEVHTSPASDHGAVTLLLHGDSTFEYTWEMHRPIPRAMEYRVELVGVWSKPVLNRSRRGDDDQRVFLTAKRIRFQRLSNYDAENQRWKMTLRTFTRHGSDWAPVGESERGVPPINLVFSCADGDLLESTGTFAVPHVLTNSPACRVLAGLTKKVANKLGGPLDVMTEKWLPSKHLRLAACPEEAPRVKSFNPFYCLAEALLKTKPSHSLRDESESSNMATTPTAAALAAAALAMQAASGSAASAPTASSPSSNNTPHLHSVTSSLRSCLDGMLPDTLRNDPAAFQQHLNHQKTRIQSEKNSWRFGLNYIFETLKQHKDWYARNQQFVQLRKDAKRLESHVASLRTILSESVSQLELEAGLRVAELEGRVGAYRIIFEVTKIAKRLSRPLVELQILQPSDTSLSIYCDTFVLDIVLASGGDGTIESASLVTVEKEVSNQFPERDEDLLQALKQLAAGESANFTDKLIRLINRAELAVRFPAVNFEQLEEEMYTTLSDACVTHNCWTVKRAVDGIDILFKDALHCLPVVVEPPRKKMRVDEANAPDVASAAGRGTPRAEDSTASSDGETQNSNPLTHGEWSGSVSFIEWRNEVALQVTGYTPLVMAGVQARRLALAIMHKPEDADAAPTAAAAFASTLPTAPQDDEKLFNEFVSWSTSSSSSPSGQEGEARKYITPQLHFTRDHSVCSVSPPSGSPMRQEYSLVTKEISGGLQLHAFPIPLVHASPSTLTQVFQICGHSLFFHSVLFSAFASKNIAFGRRIAADIEDVLQVPIKVDVAAPERITLKIDSVVGMEAPMLVEFTTNSDCSLALAVKPVDDAATPKTEAVMAPSMLDASMMQQLTDSCHSVPLVTYFALQQAIQQSSSAASGGASGVAGVATGAAGVAGGADCEGIDSLDDGIAVPMKLEGEDMLMDDMTMF